ncbi:MAG: autotransporter domain-containing protein, partial [Planctomycetaceae bacterium]|nr:autotransporter domain-containing protein [Planctomycetaceae bacterium]
VDPENPDDDVYGNVAGRNGGAIYINGKVGDKATSHLNVDNAIFQYNVAGMDGNGNGGAVYLYYADAEIANAQFYNNSAKGNNSTTGFGGGIYYENENGKTLTLKIDPQYSDTRINAIVTEDELVALKLKHDQLPENTPTKTFFSTKTLTLKNVEMLSETANSGGAVYAKNPTTIQVFDSEFSGNSVKQEGGAIYFNSNQSRLDINGTTKFSDNIAAGNGGAVLLQNNSIVNTNGTTFFSNNAAKNGGAIGIGNASELYLSNSTFNNNTATQNGGAIWINETRKSGALEPINILEIDNGVFGNNEALGNGGAIYATNTTITAKDKGVTFSENKAAQNGGALFAENSDLHLKNAAFRDNTADKGGAIYFRTTNKQDRTITLETLANASSSFTGNKSNGNLNSIYFDAQGTEVTKISLNVNAETGGSLNMADPIMIDGTNRNIDLDIVKSGTGKWLLGGTNNFSGTKIGTTFDVQEGTFELKEGSELLLTNADQLDYFKLHSNATFATSGNQSTISNLETTSLDFAAGSKMQLAGNLALDIENDYYITSILSGDGGLTKTKEDNARLIFNGVTDNYNGNVTIENGSFEIQKYNDGKDNNGKDNGTGRFVTKNGDFTMKTDTSLMLHADLEQPSLVAKSVTIDKVDLAISGISSSNDLQQEFILIHTTNGIIGNFKTVDDGAKTFIDNSLDYLTFSLGFLNDRKDYGGTISLRWYSKDENIAANGKFTIEKESQYFNVATELHDNKTNLAQEWSGTTLSKCGLGTLELSAANTYSGRTTVHAGELLLTNKQGTGLGNAPVEVQGNARLGLNFDGQYTKNVTGKGKVIQYGGTVELAGNNTYSGGTLLKGGVTEFTAENQFGTGTITFDGGTLRNKTETSLKRTVRINDDKNAQFDTPLFSNTSKSSLTFNGTISGNGGLEKTGDGILTLTGKNTFLGTTFVRNGGLNIEGSVQSDVRVQAFAAVSGSGNIIGINETNDGDENNKHDKFHTNGDLFIARDGYFDWYFSPNQADSAPLNVNGSVFLAEGAVFRPRTDSTNFTNQITGWTVLKYNKTLGGEFLAIDDTFNAFYNFELDYSVQGEIRVNGELLSHPRAMGDVITTGLSIANRKLYRNAFVELLRETVYRKTAMPSVNGSVRGQSVQPKRSVWFTPTARANRFASTFVGGMYDFEAYGMQAGSTFWSNNNSSLGLLIGYERGSLRNRLDWIRSHDYQIGLYYGHIFRSGSEFRSFIGGGFQTFTASRNDTAETYMTKYDGSSFEINTEFGKLFAGQNGTLFRPYLAFDIEYSGQSSAQENEIGNAFRHYGRADLSQFFVRFGADVEKRWQYVDLNGGASFTGLLFGQTRAQAPIFYPTRDAGTTSYGARLGRSSVTLKTGLNWHLNRQRTSTIFLDYFADIYLDRTGKIADTMQHSGNLGILVRF